MLQHGGVLCCGVMRLLCCGAVCGVLLDVILICECVLICGGVMLAVILINECVIAYQTRSYLYSMH